MTGAHAYQLAVGALFATALVSAIAAIVLTVVRSDRFGAVLGALFDGEME